MVRCRGLKVQMLVSNELSKLESVSMVTLVVMVTLISNVIIVGY